MVRVVLVAVAMTPALPLAMTNRMTVAATTASVSVVATRVTTITARQAQAALTSPSTGMIGLPETANRSSVITTGRASKPVSGPVHLTATTAQVTSLDHGPVPSIGTNAVTGAIDPTNPLTGMNAIVIAVRTAQIASLGHAPVRLTGTAASVALSSVVTAKANARVLTAISRNRVAVPTIGAVMTASATSRVSVRVLSVVTGMSVRTTRLGSAPAVRLTATLTVPTTAGVMIAVPIIAGTTPVQTSLGTILGTSLIRDRVHLTVTVLPTGIAHVLPTTARIAQTGQVTNLDRDLVRLIAIPTAGMIALVLSVAAGRATGTKSRVSRASNAGRAVTTKRPITTST